MPTRPCRLVLVVFLCLVFVLPVHAQSNTWSCHGPYGGRIRALALSPNFGQDHIVLAAAETGGLFISVDAGLTWRGAAGLPGDLTVSSMALSPAFADDHTLYIATLEGGIFRSEDGGQSWTAWSDGLASLSVT